MSHPSRSPVRSKKGFQRSLCAWYAKNARPLPWRQSPSLYKTVVSEFMLQQTQVKTALPYFERWMRAFPGFDALASAGEDRILRLWEGLGYYSRARNLHRLAREIAGLPAAPREAEAWRKLPGVGPYTAAAISSISFGARAACVDGNVVRILARLTADDTVFRDSATAAKAFAHLAASLLPESNPGDHNQAMMELGATVCLRMNPRCGACPVRRFCRAFRTGDPGAFPRFAPRRVERVAIVRAWCERRGSLLLHRNDNTARRLAGQHELPTPEQLGVSDSRVQNGPRLAHARRAITHHRITESIHVAHAPAGKLNPTLVWTPISKIESLTLSGPHRRWVRQILADRKKT